MGIAIPTQNLYPLCIDLREMLFEDLKVDNFWDNFFSFLATTKKKRKRERVKIQ
jgi:hypothetical protein